MKDDVIHSYRVDPTPSTSLGLCNFKLQLAVKSLSGNTQSFENTTLVLDGPDSVQ